MNGVNMRVPIGYKFILGFIAVEAVPRSSLESLTNSTCLSGSASR